MIRHSKAGHIKKNNFSGGTGPVPKVSEKPLENDFLKDFKNYMKSCQQEREKFRRDLRAKDIFVIEPMKELPKTFKIEEFYKNQEEGSGLTLQKHVNSLEKIVQENIHDAEASRNEPSVSPDAAPQYEREDFLNEDFYQDYLEYGDTSGLKTQMDRLFAQQEIPQGIEEEISTSNKKPACDSKEPTVSKMIGRPVQENEGFKKWIAGLEKLPVENIPPEKTVHVASSFDSHQDDEYRKNAEWLMGICKKVVAEPQEEEKSMKFIEEDKLIQNIKEKMKINQTRIEALIVLGPSKELDEERTRGRKLQEMYMKRVETLIKSQ
jgi:hypothetical protein